MKPDPTQPVRARTIAGRKIRLIPGKRYVAARPMMARTGMRRFPVYIKDFETGLRVLSLGRMYYEQANRFLAAFNNGAVSQLGRVWR